MVYLSHADVLRRDTDNSTSFFNVLAIIHPRSAMISNFSISPLSWYWVDTSTSIFEKRAGFSASVAYIVSPTLLTSALLDFMAARRLLVKHPPNPNKKYSPPMGPSLPPPFSTGRSQVRWWSRILLSHPDSVDWVIFIFIFIFCILKSLCEEMNFDC